MQVKRFVAADMRRALELVRQQLGPDAIILSSSRTAEGIELLTTMGSDSELLQLQQQPLGKMALASASPMLSDDAWSPMAVEREAKPAFAAPAIPAPTPNIVNRGKTGRQLAEEIEQARARMLAQRKAEESAKEFLVGKNMRVNAGIPRYVGSEKQESRYAGLDKPQSRNPESNPSTARYAGTEIQGGLFAGVTKEDFRPEPQESRRSFPREQRRPTASERAPAKGAIAERARTATAANPLRDREELQPGTAKPANYDGPGAIADRARTATVANPARAELRAKGQEPAKQELAARADAPSTKKSNPVRPPSSQVTIPPRRTPVPRPVLVEKKPAAVSEAIAAVIAKPKSAMTAAERYPLIDDEPKEIRQPEPRLTHVELRQPQVSSADVSAAVAPALRFIITAESDLVADQVAAGKIDEVAKVEPPVEVTTSVASEVASEQAASAAAPVPQPDAAALDIRNNKYFLDIQSEIAGMRSLLEQQFSRLQEVAPVLSAAAPALVRDSETSAVVNPSAAPNVTVAVATDAAPVAPELAKVPEVAVIPAASVAVETAVAANVPVAVEAAVPAAEVSVSTLDIPALSAELTLELPDADIPTLTVEVNSAELASMGVQASALAASLKAAEAGLEIAENNEQVLELQSEIADMRFALEQQIQRLTEGDAPVTSSSILGTVSRRLERAGLPEDIVNKVVSSCRNTESLNEAWPEAMANLARQLPVMGRDIVDEGGVFAFVGPTGVGKTTTIGKLAARYVLKHGADKVALITTDTYRIASHEQLRSIARILKVPVKVVDENNSLESLLKGLSHCAVVLIDTAGFRHGDPQLKAQLATFSGLPQVKTFVVLSTNCQAQMLKASVHAHGEARLQGCVLTKLDETSSLGEALGVVIKGWLPVAYTTDGQDIPKDLDVAHAHQLVAKAIAMIKNNPISAVS